LDAKPTDGGIGLQDGAIVSLSIFKMLNIRWGSLSGTVGQLSGSGMSTPFARLLGRLTVVRPIRLADAYY
jgi:hypothetical protein